MNHEKTNVMTGVFNRRLFSMLGALVLLLLTHPALALDVPKLEGRVNDYGHLLSPSTVSLLESVLKDLEMSDSTQIAVLTIPSLQGDSLERFSMQVAQAWEIGKKEFDNGALLLIAKDERKIRIEVGYGLEGTLTDLVTGRIIRDTITPQFRNGNFDQGVIDGVGAMIGAVKGEYQATVATRKDRAKGSDLGGLITSLIFIFFFFGSMFRKNKVVAGGIGGVAAPLLGFLFFGVSGLILAALIPVGIFGGLAVAAMTASAGAGRIGTGAYYGGHRGGFGGSSGGFGGFSGGGGGFGGGGASGGW